MDTNKFEVKKQYVAVVEDEQDISELLLFHLEKAGYRTRAFVNGLDFIQSLKKEKPAIVLLDLMLPDTDGMEICRQLKNDDLTEDIGIIMLTARSQEIDKVLGLELGADDYVTKPFSPREILARIKSLLRRIQKSRSDETSNKIYIIGDLEIDLDRFEVTYKKKPIKLTPTEFRILAILGEKPGWVYSRERLLDQLWGNEKIVIDRTIDVHIRHLREKLGPAGSLIKSIKGVGYKIES